MTDLYDLGYKEFLQSPLIPTQLAGGLISTSNIRTISGSKIRGGRLSSTDGRSYFDMDILQRLQFADATNPRILIGKIET